MARDLEAEHAERAVTQMQVWRPGQRPTLDTLAVEAPLTVRAGARAWITLMRTPGHEQELIAGLLRAEAIVHSAAEILAIAPCEQLEDPDHEGHVYDLRLADEAALRLSQRRRSTLSVSSCGVCGKEQIESSLTQFPACNETPKRVTTSWVSALPGLLRRQQSCFDQTGAVHAAGIFDPLAPSPRVVREDVGRHNAVDKALGHCFLGQGGQGTWLAVSGRVSFEIVQKAAMHGCVGIAAVSAPTSLAVQLAQRAGLSLVGFVRDQNFVCYSGEARVVDLV